MRKKKVLMKWSYIEQKLLANIDIRQSDRNNLFSILYEVEKNDDRIDI